MKSSSFIKSVTVCIFFLFPVIGISQIDTKKVTFAPNQTSTSIKGTLKGRNTIDYVLNVKKGWSLSIVLKSNNGANYFNLLPPGSDGVAIFTGQMEDNNYSGTLTESGDYKIRLYLMPSAARRNEVATYTLNIKLNNQNKLPAKTVDAKVGNTNYNATGILKSSFGKGKLGSETAEFGVIRLVKGKAEIHVTINGSNDKRIFLFSDGKWTCLVKNCSLKSIRIGVDEWEIIVNDWEHYLIPDAVIYGG